MKNKTDSNTLALAATIAERLRGVDVLSEDAISGALIELYPQYVDLLRYYYYKNHTLAYHYFMRGCGGPNPILFKGITAEDFGHGGCRIIAIHDKLLRIMRLIESLDFEFAGGYFQRHHTHTSLFLHKHFQGKAVDMVASDTERLSQLAHEILTKNSKQGYRIYYSDNFVHIHLSNGRVGCFRMNYALLPPCSAYYKPSRFTVSLVPNII